MDTRLELFQKNIICALLFYFISNLLKFIVRFFFIKSLPIEFLGINGLLSNVLALLSFAELGIGQAIVYSLYKPIAANDKDEIISIMGLYKKLYNIIGVGVIIVGVFITPYLNWFIKNNTIENLHLYYVIFVLNMGFSYFFAYKRDLIVAHQKQYINNAYKIIFQIILGILQIASLLIYANYLIYILLMLMLTFIENYFASKKASEMFPYLKNITYKTVVSHEIKKQLIKNIKALILHRIGNIFVLASPNLIISKFIGLKTLGLYSNYYMILFAVNNFAVNIFGAITANIGNLLIEETEDKKVKAFNSIQFIVSLQNALICSGFFVLLNPLIELWIGKQFLFSGLTVNLLIINFYFNYMRRGVLTFREASGLYWQDRFKPMLESMIFIISSLILQKSLGINGIIIGLILSVLFTSFWIEPYVLFNNGINVKLKDYFIDYLKFTVVALLSAFASKLIYSSLFVEVTLVNFMAGILICVSVTFVLWSAIFKNREEMQYLVNFAKSKFMK